MALGLLKALHERGRRVPEDISVVGFDDVPEAAYYWPALTTVNQDFSALGRRAVELALRALEGETDPVSELVQPEVVVRDSTGRAPTS
jgi:DNA-binding LacI/PurR family transcriptional regulator